MRKGERCAGVGTGAVGGGGLGEERNESLKSKDRVKVFQNVTPLGSFRM